MNAKLLRAAVALTATLACVALMATPAAATAHSATITGGNLVLPNSSTTTPWLITVPWAGTTGTGCGSSLTIDQDAGASTYDLTGYSSSGRFTFSGVGYVALITRTGSTSSTYTGTALHAPASMSLKIEIFTAANANPATDCTTTGTLRCRLALTLSFGGTLTGWTASGTGSLAYPSAVTTFGLPPTCAAPWTTWINRSAYSGSFSFHLTS